MDTQHQILRTLRSSEPALLKTLEQHRDKSRSAIGRLVCDTFGFYDARARPQWAGCMKALRTLESEHRIVLPAPQPSLHTRGPRLLDAPVAAPVEVPGTVGEIKDLAVERVANGHDRAIWNTLMDQEHPQGTTTFAGAQLRYLFVSAPGILGQSGFRRVCSTCILGMRGSPGMISSAAKGCIA